MSFHPGDPVVVRRIGKGIVQEVRRQGRYLVIVGAAALVCGEGDLTALQPPTRGKRARAAAHEDDEAAGHAAPPERSDRRHASVDLHGLTVEEALQRVDDRLNAAMLAGVAVLDIVHGKGGGRIRAAVHRHLRGIPSVRRFELDPRNAGVTHVHL